MKDLSGKIFGRWIVLRRAALPNYFWCRCACMSQCKMVHRSSLTRGLSKSCGCYNVQVAHSQGTHKESKGMLYTVYRSMLKRCYYPKHRYYKNYGGRGITVCDAWREFPESFFNWARSHGWQDGLTLDRIDNEKGYSPSNCRFATRAEQNRNRRKTSR